MKMDQAYKIWIQKIKQKIRSAQLKAAVTVNKELIFFYWELGEMINDKLRASNWGDKVLRNVSNDLKEEFPSMGGLSTTNLKYCKMFYEFYSNTIGQQVVDLLEKPSGSIGQQFVDQLQNDETQKQLQLLAQIPWGHNILIFT